MGLGDDGYSRDSEENGGHEDEETDHVEKEGRTPVGAKL